MRGLAALTAAFVLVAPLAAVAMPIVVSPAFFAPLRIFLAKFVASGGRVLLREVTALNPDCSTVWKVTFRILKAPIHGKLSIRSVRVLPHYPPANLRSVCNRRAIAGQRMTYTADRGYVGSDVTKFETI